MSKYTPEQQANIVGMAAELEAAIIIENEELSKLKTQQFKQHPDVPKIGSVPEPKYIPYVAPKANAMPFHEYLYSKTRIPLPVLIALIVQFVIVMIVWFGVFIFSLGFSSRNGFVAVNVVFLFIAVLSLVVAVGSLVVLIVLKKKHNLYVLDVRNSEEYKNECQAAFQALEQKNQQIKQIYDNQCKAVQEEYYAAVDNYNNVIVPTYNNELAIWTGNRDKMIALVQKDLKENMEALDTLYTTTQLIPSSYRNIERLAWIYEDMSTSEHDIERAIDLLNNKEIKDELLNIQDHVDGMRQDLRDGFVGVYTAIQEGNAIQSDMLSNLDSIRSSARTGNFLSIGNLLQNHKRNKTLSSINSKI